MTKKELAKKIAENAEMTQTQASECLIAVLDCIGEALQQGNKVVLPGLFLRRCRRADKFDLRQNPELPAHTNLVLRFLF